MYLIFNNDGSLAVSNVSDYVMQGNSNVNFIYVAIDGYNSTHATAIVNITRPDNEVIALPTYTSKFQYNGTTYYGWVATLDNTCTALAGLLKINVSVDRDNTTLATYTYNLVVNETSIPGEANISYAQFKSLMETINGMKVVNLGEHTSFDFLDTIDIAYGIYAFQVNSVGYFLNYYKDSEDVIYQSLFSNQEPIIFKYRSMGDDSWNDYTEVEFATIQYVDEKDSKFVNISGDQTITGSKTFTEAIKIKYYDVEVELGGWVGQDNFGIYTPFLECEQIGRENGEDITVWSSLQFMNGTVAGIPTPTNEKDAVNKVYADTLYSKNQNEIKDLELALFGSIWNESTATFTNLNEASIDRDDSGYPIVSNQFATIGELGAFSYVENQLQNITTTTFTNADTGLTITNNEDGTITISGTIIATVGNILIANPSDLSTYNNHYYLTSLGNSSPYLTFRIAGQSNSVLAVNVSEKIWLATADRINNSAIYMTVSGGIGETINITFRPRTIDLTLMFGAGNEPTTIEEFNQLGIAIPDSYVAPHMVSVRPTKLTSYSEYASVDMGTLNWSNTAEYPSRFTSVSLQSLIKDFTSTSTIPNILCSKYELDTPYNIWRATNDKRISLYPSGSNIWILAVDSSYTNATTFKQAMSGTILYYQPQDPKNADILGTIDITLPTQFISANKSKDYIKLVAKGNDLYDLVSVSNVGSYTFTGEDISCWANWRPTDETYGMGFYSELIPDIKKVASNISLGNLLFTNLETKTYSDLYNGNVGISAFHQADYSIFIRVPTSIATDKKTLLAWLAGKTLHYEKSTPTETTLLENVSLDTIKARLQRNGTIALDNKPAYVVLNVVAYKPQE